jgi:hypothetical protein
MKSQINWNNKIIEIQIIISIVRVMNIIAKCWFLVEYLIKEFWMLRTDPNQDYMRVNYTLIVVYTMLLVTGSQSKNVSCFCLDIAQ